ncbi:MAG: undecaprenyl/decaprenyl-phosphate alpha-N-acetylglucosaminyl 1-phosphate transferase [Planctomycetes bacterium]|nr:undecaprenyl/decaprenyl-phosphate alpha-N-acetylglucosaminyl 1-phosphate transferase [Planctomycetota bacterium]MCB9936537.1 undecaprenyl/decaprenyl-phosphate alpha-N-acetylglucosaminyl 1-phosphate transferase [Planctomycetota bacterium]
MREYIPYGVGVASAVLVVLAGGRWFRRTAWRLGLIDGPRLRGVHAEPVAKSGGMAIVTALVASLLAQLVTARAMHLEGSYLNDINHLYLLLPALAIAGLGLMDDLRPLGAAAKLAVQAAAATVAWFLFFRIDHVNAAGLVQFSAGWLSLPLTVVFIVAVTNAFNMIDGVDGLCGGAAFIALLGIGGFSMLGGELRLELALPLGAAALAFLRFNLGKPKAFLGDSGSMLLGFLVATLSLRAVVRADGALDLVPLFLLLSLPVVDITTVFFRRILQGSSPLRADRGHIHHILLLLFDGNVTRTTATLLLMAAMGAAGAIWSGWEPMLAGAAITLPIGLYAAVYIAGGYASWGNLRNAGAASDAAQNLAARADDAGAESALADAKLLDWMRLTGVTAIALFSDEGKRVWSAGVPDADRDALDIPLYASGRVERGHLVLQGPGRAGAMAFAAHLLLPLYPAFMELLAIQTAEKAVEETRV